MNIQHSSRSDLWYTPKGVIGASRAVLGKIDLDPASDDFGNSRIQATKFFTKEDDGLAQAWSGRVFINPPGGKIGNKSLTSLFWQKLMETRKEGKLTHAIFLAFSAEAMQNTQGKGCYSICDFAVCIPAKRLHFDTAAPIVKNAPSHSNAIVYVPGILNVTETFEDVFRGLGACMRGKEIR